jgi:hypothetical protein
MPKTCILYIKEKIKNNVVLLLSSSATTKEQYQILICISMNTIYRSTGHCVIL